MQPRGISERSPVAFQLLEDVHGGVDWNGEAHSIGGERLHVVDAHHLTREADEWAATVALAGGGAREG